MSLPNEPPPGASKPAAFVLPLLLILVAIALVAIASLLGVAAPMGPGEGGARLADYASVGRDLVRENGAVTAAHPGRPTVLAAAVAIAHRRFGDHAHTARIPAIVLSLLAVWALALFAWRGWGGWGAAGAVLVFAVLPRVLAFSAVPDQEMPAVVAMLMAGAAYLKCRDGLRVGAAIAMVFWLLLAGAFGWGAYAFGLVLAAGLARAGLVSPAIGGGSSQPVDSPLMFVMMARKSRALFTLAKVLLALLVIEAVVLSQLDLVVGPQPLLSLPAREPGHAGFDLLPLAAWIALGTWGVSLVARMPFRRIAFRDVAMLGLAAAGTILVVTSPAGGHRSWLTPLAVLVSLAVVDLVAQVAALLHRTGARWAALVVAPVLMLGWLTVAVPMGLRALVASRGTASAAPSEPDELRTVAKLVNESTTPRDLVLVHPTFSTSGPFHHDLDRPSAPVTGLSGLVERRDKERNLLLLFRDPLPPAEAALLGPLLRAHPAVHLGTAWIVDLRRYDAGIRDYAFEGRPRDLRSAFLIWQRLSLYPSDRDFGIRRQPWNELTLDLAFDIVPGVDNRPDVKPPTDNDRGRLLTYHSFANLIGDTAEAAGVRQRLLRDMEIPTTWMDPAPFGWVAGASWSQNEHTMVIVWDCPRDAAAVDDFALRLVLKPVARNWKSEHVDQSPSVACRGVRAGDLREDRLAVKFPYFGRWRIGLETTRPRPRGGWQPTGHTVDLVEVEHTRR